MAKRKTRTVELHGIEQANTAVMPEQEQLIKSTTETIGNFLPKILMHVTVVFFNHFRLAFLGYSMHR